MECQRCLLSKEAEYRVHTEAMEMKVCVTCAQEAQRLELPLNLLTTEKQEAVEPLAAPSPYALHNFDAVWHAHCQNHY